MQARFKHWKLLHYRKKKDIKHKNINTCRNVIKIIVYLLKNLFIVYIYCIFIKKFYFS